MLYPLLKYEFICSHSLYIPAQLLRSLPLHLGTSLSSIPEVFLVV